jgi:membrane protease YdiL (CAAX protease family)
LHEPHARRRQAAGVALVFLQRPSLKRELQMSDVPLTNPPPQRPGRQIVELCVVPLPIALSMLLIDALGIIAAALLGMLASLLLASLLLWSRGRRWADLGLRGGVTVRRLLLTVPLAWVVLFATNVLLSAVFQSLGVTVDLSTFDFLRGSLSSLLSMLAVAWIVGALGEELLFRGLFLNTLADLFRPHTGQAFAWFAALLLTSIVGGVGHAHLGPAGMVIAGVLGFGFGLVYLATKRNLWASILTHGLYDTVGFLILYTVLNQPPSPQLIGGI